MISAFFQNISLQKKFFFITASAVIFIMVTLGFMFSRWQRDIRYKALERQVRILAETLAIPVRHDLLKNILYEKLGLLESGGIVGEYFSEIYWKDIDLIYLIVLDEHGRVIAHNDANEYGKIYQTPITVNALASDSTIVQKFHDRNLGHDALDIATPLSLGKKRWGTLKFAVSLEKIDKEIHATIVSVIIFTLLLILGALLIITLVSRQFIRPITELARTMEKGSGNILDSTRIDVKGSSEIARLGENFNTMIDRIRKSNLELKQTHEKLLYFARTMEKAGGDMLDVQVDMKDSDEIAFLGQSFNKMIERIRESNLELKQTHEELLQSQKLASIGILASGVAHEINNPLGGMFNCVRMLEEMGENEDFRRRYLGLINDGLNRIEATVGKLLWGSRKKEKIVRRVDIKRSLKDAFDIMDFQIKEHNITYRENVEDGAAVMMDPHDFHQVVLNLMINAVHSMKHGGVLHISAVRNKSDIIIEVSDTGNGIEAEDLDKIFDPFYTTKRPGEGTGLGLWVTYEIVKNYDGEISVCSKINKGTTFTVKFSSV